MRAKHKTQILLVVMLTALVGFACWWQLQGGPPRTITFAAGDPNGAYYRFAQEYARRLGKAGLTVKVLATEGAVENLRLLEQGRADLAFVQSGFKGEEGGLQSLGAVFYEPVWIFVRDKSSVRDINDLKGKRIAVGQKGSGTHEVARTLLADNGLLGKSKLVSEGTERGSRMLLGGDVDALIAVGAVSPTLKLLAQNPSVSLLPLPRAEATSRFHQSLSAVTLYRGMLSLEKDIPATDLPMVAAAADLAVSKKFHYALTTLVLQTAKEIHGPAGAFNRPGEFPAAGPSTLPLTREAQSFHKSGPSFFYRHLPFYVAANVDRLILILLPVLTLLLPLGKIVPPLLNWWESRGLRSFQSELSQLELQRDRADSPEYHERLRALQDQLWELKTLPAEMQNDVFLLELRLDRLARGTKASGEAERLSG